MSLSEISGVETLRRILFPYPMYESDDCRVYIDESSIELQEGGCGGCGKKYNNIIFSCTYTDFISEQESNGMAMAYYSHTCIANKTSEESGERQRVVLYEEENEEENEEINCVLGRVYYTHEGKFNWISIAFGREISKVMENVMFNP